MERVYRFLDDQRFRSIYTWIPVQHKQNRIYPYVCAYVITSTYMFVIKQNFN